MPHTKIKNTFYLSEDHYEKQMNEIVLPFLETKRTADFFTNQTHTISCESYLLNEFSGNIILSHGFAERKEKYREAIYYFLKMGYQVFILDHYGHGESIPETEDNGIVFIEDFSHYVEDLFYFISEIVETHAGGKKKILFGHSMGGCIAGLLAETYPKSIDGLILNAPMFSIKMGVPPSLGAGVSKLSMLLKAEARSVIGFKPLDPDKDRGYNPVPLATFSEVRGQYAHLLNMDDMKTPVWGPSWKWLYESIHAAEEVIKKENVEKISVPILLLQAEKDRYVTAVGQKEFAAHAQNIEFYLIGDAGHEIYLEKDSIIRGYFNKLNDFIESVPKE